MNRLHSILIALALGTVPCVGAATIRALWLSSDEVSATSAHLNKTLDGFTGVETHANSVIDSESIRVNGSLSNVDRIFDIADQQIATVGPVMNQVVPLVHRLSDDSAKLGDAIDLVTKRCIPAPCGTLADVADTLHTVRGTFGQIETAARHENRNLTTLDTQEATLFNDFHGTATKANAGLDTANGLMANPNVTIMLANGAEFTTTAVALEKKLAACTLHPTLPCVLKSDILFGAQVGGYLLK